jgi:hypothetical protein
MFFLFCRLKIPILLILLTFLIFIPFSSSFSQKKPRNDSCSIHPDFDKYKTKVIAVVPMVNMSFESDTEVYLYNEVYNLLKSKGYARISKEKVLNKMGELGIQTPGQISQISPQRLGKELSCDALLLGTVEQSDDIHAGVYDAVVVSCTLGLRDCKTGDIIWKCVQQRAAHRQWQLDPLNALINFFAHENSSRKDRISWLVHQMYKTLPEGPIKVVHDNLLERAKLIDATK